LCDFEMLAGQHVHGQMGGVFSGAKGVVSPRQADEEPGRVDAGLTGETDQTTCGGSILGRFGSHHEHRIVQRRDDVVEGF